MRAVICGAGIVAVLVGAVAFAQNQDGRKITGVVEAAATLRPVANAHVQYEERGRPTQSTVTDSAGRFEIPTGRRGVVTISAQGFGTVRRSWPARTGRELRFSLVPPSIVRGTVDDMVTGRPIDSIVTLYVSHLTNHVSDTALAENGIFRFDDLPPGPAGLVVHADGYAPSFSELTVDHKSTSAVRIRLLLEAAATGHVLDVALVSAHLDDVGGRSQQGSARVFTRSGSTWTAQQDLIASDGSAGDSFSISVALEHGTAVGLDLASASRRCVAWRVGRSPQLHREDF